MAKKSVKEPKKCPYVFINLAGEPVLNDDQLEDVSSHTVDFIDGSAPTIGTFKSQELAVIDAVDDLETDDPGQHGVLFKLVPVAYINVPRIKADVRLLGQAKKLSKKGAAR
ncbi:MAG: hypothetical protein WC763_06995 [Candidatus Paceibacterota bacterium]|jgi:hypothetical protein